MRKPVSGIHLATAKFFGERGVKLRVRVEPGSSKTAKLVERCLLCITVFPAGDNHDKKLKVRDMG